ncbi:MULTISPECIES: TadE family type IV pilus minor pilin [unclassified Microcella]|uniref:TadE family type IV pilus minor pilin n=1 Tax=unclassified Microcella TaxID=2630066 RepID=UPI0006FCF307|nr:MULTISPECIES: TadE family type IV pilus minor pilin [unclassified Microcella]KQV26209.1 hypothetical protein ASC54_04655 [Yonghaparkia sp. Root332]KRF32995.1 hypothetical protein ASG83_03030 [Yonghaparkia sp. Soil809]
MTRTRRDRGAVTAEVAIALPAVVLVLVASIHGLTAATTLMRAQDAAADAARSVARGESAAAAAGQVVGALPGGRLRTELSGDLVCATVVVRPRILGVPIALDARSCALAGGR